MPTFEASFTPCVEIGWRLVADAWGHGYATEAATAALDHGFETAGLDEILSWTVPLNTPSRRVMERLGMHRDLPTTSIIRAFRRVTRCARTCCIACLATSGASVRRR